MTEPALKIVAERVLKRPAIMECTRLCGFADAEIARIQGIVPMTVSEWVTGKAAIPMVRHRALWLFVNAMLRILIGGVKVPPQTAHSLRARLLHQAIRPLLKLALEECSCGDPYWLADPAEAKIMANQMIERLKAMVAK
jgi:hypothetical protein